MEQERQYLRDEIQPILTKIVKAVLDQKPDNPVRFISNKEIKVPTMIEALDKLRGEDLTAEEKEEYERLLRRKEELIKKE